MALVLERADGVLAVTLNRPEAMNAIDPETLAELHQTFQEFAADPDLRVAILSGAGERAFCSGSDLKKTMPGSERFIQSFLTHARPSFATVLDVGKPTICAINGIAVGGGLELALACDLRIAAEGVSFGMPEVRLASMPGAGGTQRLLRALPQAIAMKLLLTGQRLSAADALRWGLISDLVPLPELMPLAWQLAREITGAGPLAAQAIKFAARGAVDLPLNWGMSVEQLTFGALLDTEDRMEGRKAFAERRPPVYRGR